MGAPNRVAETVRSEERKDKQKRREAKRCGHKGNNRVGL
jgi:hypothetical protein